MGLEACTNAARSVAAVALLCAVSWGSLAETKPLRPFTVDDALRMEEIGPGAFTPAADALVFVQAPPFEEFPDFGMMLMPGPRFGHLMSVGTKGDAVTRPLLPIDPAAVRTLINISPNGRYVAYLEAKAGELRLGAVDRETGKSRLSEALPEQNFIHNLAPVWVGDSKLVFAARVPDSLPPFIPYLRRATGEKLAEEWRKAWSGKSVSASVYRSRRDGGPSPPLPGRLVAFEVRDGSTSIWADGLFSDLRLAPGARHLIAIQQFERPQLPVDGLGNNWVPGRGRLALFDTATSRRIDVDAGLEVLPGTVEWSAEGRRFGFFAWRDEEASQSGVFRTFDIASKRLQSLPHTGLDLVNEREFGPPAKPMRFVWIGEDIAVPARPNPPGVSQPRFSNRGVTGRDMNADPGRFDWYWLSPSQSPRNLTARFSKISPWAAGNPFLVIEDKLHKLDARGRVQPAFSNIEVEAQPLSSSGAGSRSREPFEARVVYLEKKTGALVTFDLARATVKRIDLRDGRPEPVAISRSGEMLAYRKVQPRSTELVLRLPREKEQVVARINGMLADIDFPKNQSIKHPGAGGEIVASCLTLPPQAKAGQRLPTMVYVYPSSRPRCPEVPDLQGFTYENRAPLVSRGYALLNVAAPMVATAEGGPLDGVVAAVDRAIDAAVKTGYVDPERLAVIGASGAGFTGVWLAGHSTRFKAIVSINGIANIQSHYFGIGVSDLFYPVVSWWQGGAIRYESLDQFGLGFTPWDDPMYYWKISPIAYVKQVQTPILLVSTDMDVGGFSQQYDDMFVALKRQRKDVDYVKYWGEGHGPMSPANVRDLTRRTLEWLDKHLSAAPAIGTFGLDRSAAELSVKPGDDFFSHASGKWLSSFEIPADKTSYGPFQKITDDIEVQLRSLLDAAAASPGPRDSASQQVGDYYASFMDAAAIESAGLEPIAAELSRIQSARDRKDIAALFGTPGMQSPINLYSTPDAKHPDRYTLRIGQSGLGLPNRDYYLKDDAKLKNVREQYLAYIEQMLTLGGASDAATKAGDIMAFETSLAGVHWPIERLRDANAIYNPYTKAQLLAYAPGFEWQAFFAALEIPTREQFVLGPTTAVRDAAELVQRTSLDTLKAYLTFHYLSGHASYLPKRFDDAQFAFFGQVLKGQPLQQERWQRAVAEANKGVGQLLGRMYVETHFPPESKAKMQTLVANLRSALKQRLEQSTWLSDDTRQRALEKLGTLVTKIGYPEQWKDYSCLDVRRDDLIGNIKRSQLWEWRRDLARLDRPVDRNEWYMNPQRVNAYYAPLNNEIVFPAAILQPPFFDLNADDAVNYGGIGAVIGHEIGHGFDDQGRKFAADGRLDNWWTDRDAAAFTEQTSQLIAQYSSFEALPGLNVNGAITVGENIGDLGGLSMALHAYKLSLHGQPAPVIDGLTGEQRFFLSWAQIWRAKYRDEALRVLTLSDSHSPPRFRVNGAVRNMDEWYEAFDVQWTDALYLSPDRRVRIW